MQIKTDAKTCKIERFFYCICLVRITKHSLEKLRCFTLQKKPKWKREIGRTYRGDNEKRMINAVKKSEIKRVSGTLKHLSLRRTVPRSRKQLVSHSVPWRIRICTNFLYLPCNLLNKLHHRLPRASSETQVSRGKTTDLMLCLSKIEGIQRLGHNVLQQLSESWILFWYTPGKDRIFCFCCEHFSDVNSVLSANRFSDWSNANVRLAEHEHSSYHSQASVQQFEVE